MPTAAGGGRARRPPLLRQPSASTLRGNHVPHNSQGRAWLGADVSPAMAQAFRDLARTHDRSAAAHLRHVVRQYLVQNDIDPAANRAEADDGGRDGAHVTE